MKIILLIVSLSIAMWIKIRWNKNSAYKNLIDVTNFYTIDFTKYNIPVDKSKLEENMDETTSKIFEIFMNIDEKYEPRVFGGWVRDKLIKHQPRDIDVLIRAESISELSNLNSEIKNFLKARGLRLNNTDLFEIPIEKRGYGHEKIRVYGKEVDILIMASNKSIVPAYVKILNTISCLIYLIFN